MSAFRPLLAALAAGAVFAAAAPAVAAPPPPVTAADMAVGRVDAPVTVIEYGSVTCSHCAHWQASVWPEFKAKYVDTGKVRYVFREVMTQPAGLAMAGYLIARCGGTKDYFPRVEALMAAQEGFANSLDPRADLLEIARSHGLTDAQANACLADKDAVAAVNARHAAAGETDIKGTPTFFVNGRLIEDAFELDSLEAAIQPALAKASR